MKKRILVPVCAVFLALLLTGCGARTIDEMYCLPRRSERNNNLRTAIEASMSGRVYAAPVSGSNQESVQTADLDGDGKEEYVVFTKVLEDDSLQILLFNQLEDEKYELWETIVCKGASFEQVQYADIDDKPGCELIVGTQLNEKVTRTVSLYSFASGQTTKIKSMIYIKFVVCDLDSNGRSELMVIQNGEAEADSGSVRLYSYSDGNVVGSVEAKLSVSPEHIRRIAVNKLDSGEPAVYVASASNENAVITDIFALRDETFSNISQSSDLGTSMQTLRNYFVYAEDLNNDGILELPSLLSMMYNTTEQNLIRWFTIDINGRETDKLYTFHNIEDGWYIQLDGQWIDRFAAEKNETIYSFYMWNNSYGTAVPVFTVYTLTGKDRDIQAQEQNRFPLYRGEDVVYAAKLESGSAIYGMTESYLRSNFHLIRQDWKMTES
ncbi:MAG: hypothetical protein SO355_01535 [Candidatus Faecousia sp.]|nr:hypothetical protein [Bacillota bacterium]MDY4754013.1 hypothetical protein [Candidatus Faecousia sp.]MDY6161353.1 hypothetical protein [Candidatus Faecousia sp.]